jgi:hypothetical protein
MPKRYREQAEWPRGEAETAAAPELQEQWLRLARKYERLPSDLGKSFVGRQKAVTGVLGKPAAEARR